MICVYPIEQASSNRTARSQIDSSALNFVDEKIDRGPLLETALSKFTTDRVRSVDLASALGMDVFDLEERLGPINIRPHQIRVGKGDSATGKGYSRKSFQNCVLLLQAMRDHKTPPAVKPEPQPSEFQPVSDHPLPEYERDQLRARYLSARRGGFNFGLYPIDFHRAHRQEWSGI